MDSFIGASFNQNFSQLDDSKNESLANLSTKYMGFDLNRTQNQSNTASCLFKSNLLNNSTLKNKSVNINDLDEADSSQSSIFTQFKIDTNKFIDEERNLIELLKSYCSICADHSHFLKEKIQHLTTSRQKNLLNLTLNEQEELEKEKYLWDLIILLYSDELETSSKSDNQVELLQEENNGNEGVNEQQIARNLERKNSFLRRVKLIITWLEKIAAESNNLKLIKEKMSAFSEKCFSWEHTLHHLKNLNNFNRKEKVQFTGRDYVNELDPDAPIRQCKPLHDLDQEDEYKMMEFAFSFIRAGDLNSARDFCFKVGQSWRAATFEGFKLFNDENYSSNSANAFNNKQQCEVFKNEGNLNRDIWRLTVHKLIKNENFNPYEKAVYASLAGFINPVIPVCRTYMDFLWIFLKALYNHIVEKEIRQKITIREFINIPYETDEESLFSNLNKQSNELILNQIFDRVRILIENTGNAGLIANKLSDSSNVNNLSMSTQIVKALKLDAQRPFSIILKHVILSGINGFKSGTNELMEYMKTIICNEKQNGHLLRFSSHLSLFYRSASFQIKNDLFNQITEYYVQYLIENNYKEIIAYYLSQLPSELQIKHYSRFLQTISDNKERVMLLKLAKERNMNVQAITLNIVDNLSKNQSLALSGETKQNQTLNQTAMIAKTTDLFTFKSGQILNEEDKKRINALDWIVYDPMQRLKLLEYANLTMRYFLLNRQNLEATKTIFTKIPQDTLAIILTQFNFNQLNQSSGNVESNLEQMIENLPLMVTNSIKEYLCFKEYIEAIYLYNDWFEFYHKEKPIKPVSKFQDTDQEQSFADRMAFDYQMKQYEDLMSRWYTKALMYTEKVKAKFFGVLKFPFGGWMVDIEKNADFIVEGNDDEELIDEHGYEDQEANMSEEDNEMESDENDDKNKKKQRKLNNQRKQCLQSLRKIYLPNICFVLLDMMSKMNLNKELIRLSDLISSDQYKLYNLFENPQLRVFLNKIADASISLLDSNLDYLGYN